MVRDGKFQVGLCDKRESFLFSNVKMPDKSSNVPSNIATLDTFSTATKPFFTHMSRQAVYNGKINSIILKFLNKHQGDFNNVCRSRQELIDLVS